MPNQTKSISKSHLIGCFTIMLYLMVYFSGCTSKNEEPPTPWYEKDNSWDAAFFLQESVRERLKSPSRAEFPAIDYNGIVRGTGKENHRYIIVMSYVDSQNSFGAMIRTKYTGIVEQTGEYEWRIIKLKFLN